MNRLTCHEASRGDGAALQCLPEDRFLALRPRWEPGSGRTWEEIHGDLSDLADSNRIVQLTSSAAQAVLNSLPPSWPEYLASLSADVRDHAEAARSWLLSRPEGIPTSDEWCNDYYLIFSDGRILDVGWRTWAEFVAACVNKREPYIKYYDRETCNACLP